MVILKACLFFYYVPHKVPAENDPISRSGQNLHVSMLYESGIISFTLIIHDCLYLTNQTKT